MLVRQGEKPLSLETSKQCAPNRAMSLFCSFSPFVMGKLFLRKVKFYGSYILLVMLACMKYPVLPIVLQREKTLREG